MAQLIDCTAAYDDWLTERYRTCLVCGKRAAWLDVRVVNGRGKLGCVCHAHHSPQGWRAVDRLFHQRYGRNEPRQIVEVVPG
jgi:hypothetical protein